MRIAAAKLLGAYIKRSKYIADSRQSWKRQLCIIPYQKKHIFTSAEPNVGSLQLYWNVEINYIILMPSEVERLRLLSGIYKTFYPNDNT